MHCLHSDERLYGIFKQCYENFGGRRGYFWKPLPCAWDSDMKMFPQQYSAKIEFKTNREAKAALTWLMYGAHLPKSVELRFRIVKSRLFNREIVMVWR
jgi:hypothetical protein